MSPRKRSGRLGALEVARRKWRIGSGDRVRVVVRARVRVAEMKAANCSSLPMAHRLS